MKNYSFLDFITNFISFCYTKLFYSKVKLIRLPISIRGKKNIKFGKGLVTGKYCRIDTYASGNSKVLTIGSNCQLNDFVHIGAIENITIGDNVLIASKVFITDHLHGKYSGDNQSNPLNIIKDRELSSQPVFISNNVWIGESVSILPGITIGENSIIGANSVVTKDIPDNCIAVGIPAKVIKKFNFESKTWIQTINK